MTVLWDPACLQEESFRSAEDSNCGAFGGFCLHLHLFARTCHHPLAPVSLVVHLTLEEIIQIANKLLF